VRKIVEYLNKSMQQTSKLLNFFQKENNLPTYFGHAFCPLRLLQVVLLHVEMLEILEAGLGVFTI
jgi:hypothetical protein